MNSAELHLGEITADNILQYIQKPSECAEQLKWVEDKISHARDSFERAARPAEMVCDCYPNYHVCTGMPQSIFADKFGNDMQKDIVNHMRDLYAGKISQDEINHYFEECCMTMRKYRTQHCQTSGTNENDNMQIINQMYEIFAKENQRAARNVNYMEGEKINASYGSSYRSDDWTYYNADYYYKCDEIKSELRQATQNLADKWGDSSIDFEEIERNSEYILDGGLDFNSGWNFTYRNQAARSSMADESLVPPKDFKFFFKEGMYPDSSVDKGLVRVWLGKKEYTRKVPFELSRTGIGNQIFNAGELLQDDLSKSESYREYSKFLSNFFVFTRWYSWGSGINNKFGNYYL